MKNAKRLTVCLILLVLVISALAVTALAADPTTGSSSTSGDVSSVVTSTWTAVKAQLKTVCSSVVFPALGGGLTIWFLVECGMCYANYKKSHSLSLTGPIVLFISAVVVFTAPLYIWTIIGW